MLYLDDTETYEAMQEKRDDLNHYEEQSTIIPVLSGGSSFEVKLHVHVYGSARNVHYAAMPGLAGRRH